MSVYIDFFMGNGSKIIDKLYRGELVKENKLTVWVRLADGNIIKRHRLKHGVHGWLTNKDVTLDRVQKTDRGDC